MNTHAYCTVLHAVGMYQSKSVFWPFAWMCEWNVQEPKYHLPTVASARLVAFGKTKLFISTPNTLSVLERERKRQLGKWWARPHLPLPTDHSLLATAQSHHYVPSHLTFTLLPHHSSLPMSVARYFSTTPHTLPFTPTITICFQSLLSLPPHPHFHPLPLSHFTPHSSYSHPLISCPSPTPRCRLHPSLGSVCLLHLDRFMSLQSACRWLSFTLPLHECIIATSEVRNSNKCVVQVLSCSLLVLYCCLY